MDDFVETWKGIASFINRSERWCRYMSRLTADPLPVFKVGGIVRMRCGDFNDWVNRRAEAGLTPHKKKDRVAAVIAGAVS